MNAKPNAIKSLKFPSLILYSVVIVVFLGLFASASTRYYSPDSWAFLDVANGIQKNNFSAIDGTRDFSNSPWINDSFPFGFPILQLIFAALFDLQWSQPIGVYVALIFCCLILLTTMLFFRGNRGPNYIAPLFLLALLSVPEVLSDIVAGRSHIVGIFFLLSCFLLLLSVKEIKFKFFLAGLMLGALSLIRFDSLMYGPLIAATLTVFLRTNKMEVFKFLIGWVLGPLAWSAYSVLNFSSIYTVDNSLVAKSQRNIKITDYPTEEILGQIGLSIEWVNKLLSNSSGATSSSFMFFSWLILPMIMSLLIISISMNRSKDLNHKDTNRFMSKSNYLLLTGALIYLLTYAQQTLTGYFDQRYWINSAVVIVFAIVVKVSIENHFNSSRLLPTMLGALAVIGVLNVLPTVNFIQPKNLHSDLDSIRICMENVGGSTLVSDHNLSAKIAALTGKRTVMLPSNFREMSQGDWGRLINDYDVRNVLLINGGNDERERIPQSISSIDCNY